MSLTLTSLPRILYNPKAAFSEMRNHTYLSDGIMIYAILFVSSITVFYLMFYTGTFTQAITPLGVFYSTSYILSFTIQSFVSLLVIGAAVLLLTAFIATHMAHFLFRTGTSFGTTVGLLGYTYIIDLIIGIAISLVMAFGFSAALSTTYSENVLGVSGFYQTMILATLALTVVAFIWKLYVGGYAISIANNISANSGVLIYLLSAILVTLIIYVVGVLLSSVPGLNIFAATRAY